MKKLLTLDVGLDRESPMLLLRDNACLFEKELTESCPENVLMEQWILHLFDSILDKCYLVIVSTSGFDVAYHTFSTINTRGLDLTL